MLGLNASPNLRNQPSFKNASVKDILTEHISKSLPVSLKRIESSDIQKVSTIRKHFNAKGYKNHKLEHMKKSLTNSLDTFKKEIIEQTTDINNPKSLKVFLGEVEENFHMLKGQSKELLCSKADHLNERINKDYLISQNDIDKLINEVLSENALEKIKCLVKDNINDGPFNEETQQEIDTKKKAYIDTLKQNINKKITELHDISEMFKKENEELTFSSDVIEKYNNYIQEQLELLREQLDNHQEINDSLSKERTEHGVYINDVSSDDFLEFSIEDLQNTLPLSTNDSDGRKTNEASFRSKIKEERDQIRVNLKGLNTLVHSFNTINEKYHFSHNLVSKFKQHVEETLTQLDEQNNRNLNFLTILDKEISENGIHSENDSAFDIQGRKEYLLRCIESLDSENKFSPSTLIQNLFPDLKDLLPDNLYDEINAIKADPGSFSIATMDEKQLALKQAIEDSSEIQQRIADYNKDIATLPSSFKHLSLNTGRLLNNIFKKDDLIFSVYEKLTESFNDVQKNGMSENFFQECAHIDTSQINTHILSESMSDNELLQCIIEHPQDYTFEYVDSVIKTLLNHFETNEYLKEKINDFNLTLDKTHLSEFPENKQFILTPKKLMDEFYDLPKLKAAVASQMTEAFISKVTTTTLEPGRYSKNDHLLNHTVIVGHQGYAVELLNSVTKEELDKMPEDLQTFLKIEISNGDTTPQKKVIGEGSFGKVRLARLLNRKDGDPEYVVVKKVDISKNSTDPSEEAQLMMTINSDYIPKVFDVISSSDNKGAPCLYTFMEVLTGGDGTDLKCRLNKETKSSAAEKSNEVTRILSETLKGISSLHREGVYHRDIKLGNILITGSKAVKITDFGISTKEKNCDGFDGTPFYLAPEVTKGKKCDASKADIYAFSVMAVELYLSSEGFGESDYLFISKETKKFDRDLLNSSDSIRFTKSDMFKHIIYPALDPNPDLRPTAEDLCTRLNHISS